MGWCFGLLQEKNGSLVLCEMYDLRKHGWAAARVDWKQVRRDKKMILGDLTAQIKTKTEFYVLPNDKINVKRKGRWSKRKAVPYKLPKRSEWKTFEEVKAELFQKKKKQTKD